MDTTANVKDTPRVDAVRVVLAALFLAGAWFATDSALPGYSGTSTTHLDRPAWQTPHQP